MRLEGLSAPRELGETSGAHRLNSHLLLVLSSAIGVAALPGEMGSFFGPISSVFSLPCIFAPLFLALPCCPLFTRKRPLSVHSPRCFRRRGFGPVVLDSTGADGSRGDAT